MVPVSVAPNGKMRDTTFNLKDSCNCCWCCQPPIQQTDAVYVTRRFAVERFKATKTPHVSHSLAHEHLREGLRLKLSAVSKDLDFAMMRLQDLAEIDLDDEKKFARPLTLSKIDRINRAVEAVILELRESPK